MAQEALPVNHRRRQIELTSRKHCVLHWIESNSAIVVSSWLDTRSPLLVPIGAENHKPRIHGFHCSLEGTVLPPTGTHRNQCQGRVKDAHITSIVVRQPHARVTHRGKWHCVFWGSLAVHRCTSLCKVHNVKRWIEGQKGEGSKEGIHGGGEGRREWCLTMDRSLQEN